MQPLEDKEEEEDLDDTIPGTPPAKKVAAFVWIFFFLRFSPLCVHKYVGMCVCACAFMEAGGGRKKKSHTAHKPCCGLSGTQIYAFGRRRNVFFRSSQ